eukprot:gene4873-21204_t
MGKVLSKQDKPSQQSEESMRKEPVSRIWKIRQFFKEMRKRTSKSADSGNSKESFYKERIRKDTDRIKKMYQGDSNPKRYKRSIAEELFAKDLKGKGLDDSTIYIIYKLGLSKSFFSETDQAPGRSFVDDQVKQSSAVLRMKKQRTKKEMMELAKQNAEASKKDYPTLKTASGDDEAKAKSLVPAEMTENCDMYSENQEYDPEKEKVIDGLYAHMCYFSPKVLCGVRASIADQEKRFKLPMIEIVTKETPECIMASVIVNQTVVEEQKRHCFEKMYSSRLDDTLNMQMAMLNLVFQAQWKEFPMQVQKGVYNRFATAQIILKKIVPYQCSLAEAERMGIC